MTIFQWVAYTDAFSPNPMVLNNDVIARIKTPIVKG